jgi:hypothetical protein
MFDEASALMNRRSLAVALVRQLMANQVAVYKYVDKNPETGAPQTRTLTKHGPVAVIVTTTATVLDPELDTRLLRVHVDDSAEQTAQILATEGARAAGSWPAPPDIGPWHALQQWLQHGGPCGVVIPFAKVLAARIQPGSIRLRRDFPTLLSLIAAHGLLHRASRAVDDKGRIAATFDDYAAVRELMLEAFAVSSDRRLPPMQRRVQRAIAVAAHQVFLEGWESPRVSPRAEAWLPMTRTEALATAARRGMIPAQTLAYVSLARGSAWRSWRSQSPARQGPAKFLPALPISVRAVARATGIPKSSVARSIDVLIATGHLVVSRPKRGGARLLRLGDPLPHAADDDLLPPVATLARALEATQPGE